MPLDDSQVLPNFEAHDTADVLPPGFTDEIGMAPPEPPPARIRTRFDPEGRGPRQGMSFGENVAGAYGSGTIEGALQEAETLRLARGGTPTDAEQRFDPVGAGMEGLISAPPPELTLERAEVARQQARSAVFDQIAYDLAPTNVTPRSVLGTLLGGVMAPSNALSFGGGAVASRLGAAGAGRVAQAAASTAVAAGVSDVGAQTIRTLSGGQEEFNIPEAVLAPIAGGLLGAGGHVVGEAAGKAAGSVAALVRRRLIERAAFDPNMPREALPAEPATHPLAPADQTAPTALPLREEEPAARMPPAEPDPTAPVSREQADGQAETPPTEPDRPAGQDLTVSPAASEEPKIGAEPGQPRPLTSQEIINDLPGALEGANVDAKRFSHPPSPDDLDRIIEAGRAHEGAEVDRVFGEDAAQVKRLMRSNSDSAYDKLEALVAKHGPEAEAVAYGRAEPRPGEKGIVDIDELRKLREAISHSDVAAADYVQTRNAEDLGRELAWLAPKLPDVNAADASHTVAERTAVLQLARIVDTLDRAGVDPRPPLKAAADFTMQRVNGNADDATVLLERLADFTRRYVRVPDQERPASPAAALPAPSRAEPSGQVPQVAGDAQGLLYRRRAGGGTSASREPTPKQVEVARAAYVKAEADNIAEELFRKKAPVSEEPDQIQKGRPVEDQGTEPLSGDARPARLEELAQRLASDFDTILRTGRVKAGAKGQYSTTSGISRVRSLPDLDTAVHEIGHSLQQSPQTGSIVSPVIARNRAELAPLGAGTGATGDAEAFAELFRLYTTNRAYAARTYPNATADLERTLRSSLPAQADALDRLRADLDVIHRADSGAIVGSDVITAKPDNLFRRTLDLFGADFIGAASADPRGSVFYAWRDALYTRMVSPQHPIGRAQAALGRLYRENTGKGLDLLPQDDPYIMGRLGAGSRTVADSTLSHGVRPATGNDAVGPSFHGAIETAIGKRWTPEQWHDFGAYLTARRMVAEYERFTAGEIPNPPGRLSAEDYARAVKEFDGRYPTFAEGAAQLYQFQDNHLQRAFEKGLFTKDYVDTARSRRDYVPAMRDMEDLGAKGMSAQGKRDGASMMKAFRGSKRSVLNPLDAIHNRIHDLEAAIAINDTKQALARLAETAGPGSGFIAEPIPSNKLSPVRVDVVDALRAAGSRANVDNLDLGALIHQAEGLLGDDVFAHIFRQEQIRPGREPITFYYVGGERRALRLSDGRFGAELYNALNNMTEPEKNIFFSVLQISQQVLRSGVTKSLGFIYRNIVRDQFTSVATGGRAYVPFVSALKGGFDVVRGGGDFDRYLSFGGFGGGAIHEAVEQSGFGKGAQAFRARAAYDPRRVLGVLGKATELSEAATRAGLFKSFTKQAQDLGFDAYNADSFDNLETTARGLRRKWYAESDRIVARVRGEGPRL